MLIRRCFDIMYLLALLSIVMSREDNLEFFKNTTVLFSRNVDNITEIIVSNVIVLGSILADNLNVCLK